MSTANLVSEAVLSANRANAQLSTGPRTAEGKHNSSQNSTIHGAYSTAVLLPGDDLSAYEALGAQLKVDYTPETDLETRLYTEILETTWRLTRIASIERSTLFLKTAFHLEPIKIRFADQISDPAIIRQLAQAEAYSTNARLFGQLHREEKRLRTLVETKSDELLSLRERREADEFELAKKQVFIDARAAHELRLATEAAAKSDTELRTDRVRSVSQEIPTPAAPAITPIFTKNLGRPVPKIKIALPTN